MLEMFKSVISFELATDNEFVVLVLNTDNRPINKQQQKKTKQQNVIYFFISCIKPHLNAVDFTEEKNNW